MRHHVGHHAAEVAHARGAVLRDRIVDDLLELVLRQRLRHELGQHSELALLRRCLLLAAAASAIYAAAWMARVVALANPVEYRENALVLSTSLMCDGENPYALAHQPVFANVYGIMYPLAVLPVAKAFGSGFLVHRLLSSIFVILAGLCLIHALRTDGVSWPFAALGGMLLFAELGCSHAVAARPDSLGVLFLMLSVSIPWRMKLSATGLAAGAVFSILGFFTKPYFLLGLPLIASYLFLFVSMRRAIAFAALSLAALAAAVAAIHALCPAYFTNVFFIHLNAATSDFDHLLINARS